MRPDRRLAAVALLLFTAGCGTTVSGISTAATSRGSGTAESLSVAAGRSGAAGPVSAAAGGSSSAATGAPGAAVAGGTGSIAAGAGAAAAGTTAPTTQGVGVTHTKIYVGISYTTNEDAANAAMGAAGITSGDEKADAQAVVDDINAHGGVAGRTLAPVYAAYDAQSQDTRANQDQAVCAAFTQDHHVAAVMGVGLSDNFLTCVLRSGAIDIDSGVLIDPDNEYFRQFPYYFDAGTLSQDRMMAELVRTLARMRYFTGWNATSGKPAASSRAKLGVLGVDVPEWDRPTQHVLLPALKAAGYDVAPNDVRMIYNPNSTAEDGQTLTSIQNAELQFRQDGVTHVILLDTGGQLLTYFGKDAKSQHYYPRYGLTSGSGVQAIYDAGLVDADQLAGAVGLGWDPSLDLSGAAAAAYETPATKHCLQVMKARTGQTYSSTNAASIALSICDELYLFARAADGAGDVVNHDTLRSAIESLHASFVPAAVPGNYFAPGRHDGVQLGFDLTWDAQCTCARYVSKARQIP